MHTDDAITARTAKACVVFGRLCANVKERNGIKLEIQLKVYKSVVLPTHLYAYGTWTVYQRHAKILNLTFPLEKIEKIVQNQMARQDPRHGGHAEGRDANMHAGLKLVQMDRPDERLPQKVIQGELKERKRSQGGQKKGIPQRLNEGL